MSDIMGVLAMDAEDFKYLDAAKAKAGNHPDEWIPLYTKLRQADKKQKALAMANYQGGQE
jgi:type IV secretion system protein VirB4